MPIPSRARVGREGGDVGLEEEDASALDAVPRKSHDRVEEGGLSRAVGPEQNVGLARRDAQSDVVQESAVADAERQPFDT
jgi:hypothetical protein